MTTAVYVDLDGTLVHTDLLVESAVRFVFSRPFQAYRLIVWLARGKAHLKAQLAKRVELDPSSLPYNAALLDHLSHLAAQGTPLYLATAANEVYAQAVAKHLGVFSGVLSSNDVNNLSGARKRDAIERSAGEGFVYAGNGSDDLPIWSRSAGAWIVDAPASVQRRIDALQVPVLATFDRKINRVMALLRAMRPHQWLKNLLVLLPVLPIAVSCRSLRCWPVLSGLSLRSAPARQPSTCSTTSPTSRPTAHTLASENARSQRATSRRCSA